MSTSFSRIEKLTATKERKCYYKRDSFNELQTGASGIEKWSR